MRVASCLEPRNEAQHRFMNSCSRALASRLYFELIGYSETRTVVLGQFSTHVFSQCGCSHWRFHFMCCEQAYIGNENVPKIITSNTINLFFKCNRHFGNFTWYQSPSAVWRNCFLIFYLKMCLFFSTGDDQPREPALWQILLYFRSLFFHALLLWTI